MIHGRFYEMQWLDPEDVAPWSQIFLSLDEALCQAEGLRGLGMQDVRVYEVTTTRTLLEGRA